MVPYIIDKNVQLFHHSTELYLPPANIFLEKKYQFISNLQPFTPHNPTDLDYTFHCLIRD